MARWSCYGLIAIDEVRYVPLAEVGDMIMNHAIHQMFNLVSFTVGTLDCDNQLKTQVSQVASRG
ncbi:MAG TPA: hypothetical protein VK724_09820 [Bryobacteraceae bacterium]|jgi:hypothetical protein|nr:hypothetical protein [Bryobacteraceae bacterium]